MSSKPMSSDTSAKSEAVMLAIYRGMPAWRKVQLVDDANRTARQLALTGLRSRHPGESSTVLRRRLLGLVLGEELALRVYGPLQSPVHEETGPMTPRSSALP